MLKRFGLALFAPPGSVICSRPAEGCTPLWRSRAFRWRRRLRFSCPLSFAFCGGIKLLCSSTDAAFRSCMAPQNRSSSFLLPDGALLFRRHLQAAGAKSLRQTAAPFCLHPPASTVTGAGVVPAGASEAARNCPMVRRFTKPPRSRHCCAGFLALSAAITPSFSHRSSEPAIAVDVSKPRKDTG